MAKFLAALFATSVVGLALSTVAYIASLAGLPPPFGFATWLLHILLVGIGIATAVVCNRLGVGFDRHDVWRTALHDGPAWARWLVRATVWYAVATMVWASVVPPPAAAGAAGVPALEVRVFSAVWVAAYASLAVLLYLLIVQLRPAPTGRVPHHGGDR